MVYRPNCRTRSALATVALIVASGCSAPPRPDVPGAARRATGLSNAIFFDTTGGPLDLAGETPETLTLPQAVRSAVTSDPKVQQALAKVREAEADADQARLWPNPVITFVIGLRRKESAFINASLTEDLLAFLSQPRRISTADDRLRTTAADALTAVLEAIAAVQVKYAAVQADDAQLLVLQERHKIIEQLLHVAKARLDIGEGTRLDVLTLDTERVVLEADIADRQLLRTTDRLALARLIGQPSGRTDWTLMPWQAPNPVSLPESRWLTTALTRRPELQSQKWELAALGDEIALARLSLWAGSLVGPEVERDPTWWEGPSFQAPVPIFDWGQARVRKARAARIEARHKLTDVRRQVVEEVRRAYATFAQAHSALRKTEAELVPLQQRRREQAEAAYQAGESDLATLLLAEEGLLDAQLKLIDIQQKLSVALIDLQRSVGGSGVAEDLVRGAPTTQPTTRAAIHPPGDE